MRLELLKSIVTELKSNNLSLLKIDQDISASDAKTIAKFLEQNTSVVSLEIYDSFIDEDGLSTILWALRNHPNIQCITLDNIEVDDEALDDIIQCLQSATRLSSLKLCNNSLTDSAIEKLTHALITYPRLFQLELSNQNHLERSSFEAISHLLSVDHTLQELVLCDNQMGNRAAENIATSLIENTTLTRLNLSNNSLNQCGIHAIARAIANHRSIDSIDLSLNKITENSCQELVTALDSNLRIKTLVLSDCELSSESIQHLASYLPTSRLKALDLSKNTIDEISAIQLAHALQNNTELHSLELHNVGRNGIAHIAKALEFNSTLISINLSCNELNTSEIEAVAQMLYVNTSLLCINLSQNPHPLLMSLGNIEQKRNELIEYLQHHPVPEINVIELYLNPDLVINWCKKLAFLSTKQLISAVAVNSILQSIYLCHNQYNDFEAVAIANMLAVNQSLEVMSLRSNSIGNKGVKAIAKSLEVNNSLKTLYLESNDFYGEGAQALAAATHINLTLEELSTNLYLCPIQIINKQLFMNLIIEDENYELSIEELQYHLEQTKLDYPDIMPIKVKCFMEKLQLKLAHKLWTSNFAHHQPSDLRKILHLLQYHPFNAEAIELSKLCIARLYQIEIKQPLLSFHLLKEIGKKIEASLDPCALKLLLSFLSSQEQYQPNIAGGLVAIPSLMGHLNCEPWLESNHDAYQLLDTYMGQQLQAPLLQAAIICEDNALDILHKFQFESSASISSNSLFSSAALSETSQQKSLKRKMG